MNLEEKECGHKIEGEKMPTLAIPDTRNQSEAKEERERASTQNQLKGMEILLRQNHALENEVERLCHELDTVSMGIQKNGYLYKWREREIYYAPKWGLRYFVLHRDRLSYYGDENERRPRRTIDLSKCCIKVEGTKKKGLYHVFSIYLSDDSLEDSLVLRLSSDNSVDANQWIEMLERACYFYDQSDHRDTVDSSHECSAIDHAKEKDKSSDKDEIRETTTADDLGDSSVLSPVMLKRVRSATRVLTKSKSRHLLGDASGSHTPRSDNLSPNQRVATAEDMGSKHTALSPTKKPRDKRVLKSFPAYKPMHLSSIPSPLSSETRPGEYNYRGFFNLMVIILGITHCDLIVNNISKYGFKFNITAFIRPPEAVIDVTDIGYETASILVHFLKAVLTWIISITLNYSIEKYASKHPVNERFILALNFLVGTFNFVAPCYWVWTSKGHPGLNFLYLFQSVIIWMKLISYAHANKDLRIASRWSKKADLDGSKEGLRSGYSSGEDLALTYDNNAKPISGEQYVKAISEVKDLESPFLLYPQNITLTNLGYFLIAPTLCYQLNFPRNEKMKWDKIFFLVFRLIVIAFAMLFALEQYIKPTLEQVVKPMSEGNILGVAERLLKLSIPNTYLWLLMFYFYFHLWLNLLAEITRFGDRLFYKDWWNARTIDRYWRTWNIPVHHWVTRHLYYPLLRAGCSKAVATFVVFFFSAFMHEVVISIPFRHISFHAFFGMLAQAPLIVVTKYIDRRYDNSFIGNAFFWCTFCIVGQPMGVIMYYYDLYKLSTGSPA